MLLFSALTAAVLLMHEAADWPPLQAEAKDRAASGDVLDQMSQAAIKRSAPFEISEARLNAYLAERCHPVVSPPLDRWVQAAPPALDLRDREALLRLSWRWWAGWSTDLTVRLSLEREGDTFVIRVVDGAYGRLQVPRGLLAPMRSTLESLGIAFQAEIQALFKMNQIRIQQDRLVLDPRF